MIASTASASSRRSWERAARTRTQGSSSPTPLDAQNVDNRHFKPLLRRAGLPDLRWHDLRHSCFTLLLSRGVHPKFVQHASIQLTLDRYSHWMPSMGKHTASAMDEALDEADREAAE
jgi:integrase